MREICTKEQCTGCTACESICVHNAINMRVDSVGFLYPEINANICIKCGMCDLVCPIFNEISQRKPVSSWVAKARDNAEQLTSTSGGIASVLSRYIIEDKKGVVYGCSSEDSNHVRHIRIDKIKDLHKLKGSKYVQSDITGIFRSVKRDLLDLRTVLFIGTPCQNAGLISYLRKDYDNLYCVDFVCHGVPSQKMLSDHINDLGLDKNASTVAFRYKRKSRGSKYMLTITDKCGSILYKKPYGIDLYMSGFILGLFYRESCYHCKYAVPYRVSDLTIGDYWDKTSQYSMLVNSDDGLSQMNINTEKGKRLINEISKEIECESIDLHKLLEHSHQLQEPMKRHVNNSLFMHLYPIIGFKRACEQAMMSDYIGFRKQRILDFLFLIPGTRHLYNIIKGK